MQILDIIIILIAVVGLFFGYKKGIIRQLGSLVAIIIGILVCQAFGDKATELVGACAGVDTTQGPTQGYYAVAVVAYVGLFLLVWIGIWLLARLVSATAKMVHLSPLDSMLGAPFMSFKCILVVSILLNVWKAIVPNSTVFTHSGAVVDWATGFAPWILGLWQENITGL